MGKAQQTKLQSSFKKYLTNKKSESSLLKYLKFLMPEIIYRSTRLEGEKVTRSKVSSFF